MSHSRIASLILVAAPTIAGAAHADTIKTGGNVINETWTPAGSPYIVQGDLTVPSGAFLTVEAGTVVRFAAGDAQASGRDSTRTELIIRGTLAVNGTAAQPVQFLGATPSAGSWYGVVLDPLAVSVTLSNLQIANPMIGILQLGASTIVTANDVSVTGHSQLGIEVSNGAATYQGLTVIGTGGTGVGIDGSGSATLTGCLLRGNALGISFQPSSGSGLTVTSCTVHGNANYGVFAASSQRLPVAITNSIITNNGVGVNNDSFSPATVSISFSDIWNNSSANLRGTISQGAGNISQNPQYVSATDLRLQGSSVCIDAGSSAGAPSRDIAGAARPLDGDGINGAAVDMGAYEFVRVAACGNGVLEAGEVCDSGMLNGSYGACNATCTGPGPRCGDGVVNGPESCDDGNQDNTDGCLNTCVVATCGDGFVHAGFEVCDDGNHDNSDGCTDTCVQSCDIGITHGGTGAASSDVADEPDQDAGCSAAGQAGAPSGALGALAIALAIGLRRRRPRA